MPYKDPCPDDPNPLMLFAASGSISLAQKIAESLNVPLSEARTDPFGNGECMVRVNRNVRQRDVFVISSVCRQWNTSPDRPFSGVNDALMELLVWGDTLSLASAFRTTAVIPYFGYARQDRKVASRTPISARLICDLLETAGFDRVLTMDLHADQIQGFFSRRKCNLDHLNAGEIFSNYFSAKNLENAVILAPDLGNVKQADRYRKGMPANVGMAIIDKRRNPHTGEVTANRLAGDELDGKSVIMFDDIISSGSTMRKAIDLAEQNGAQEFYLAATHGEFIGKAKEHLNHPLIREICVTDSMPTLPEIRNALPVKVLSVSSLFGEAIKRIHNGKSISALLGKFS